jgi:hypothetical protein
VMPGWGIAPVRVFFVRYPSPSATATKPGCASLIYCVAKVEHG